MDYNILAPGVDVNGHIFFRGRKSSVPLSQEDLFHIPFNQRCKITNQRYSISGQPLLYLARSPTPIIYELKNETFDFSNIYFCSFLHVGTEPLKILDLTNKYPEQFNDVELANDPDQLFCDYTIGNDQNCFKFILTQFCSFKRNRRTENEVFSEEYVLPQILTSILREYKFHGIQYSSTRVNSKTFLSNAEFHVNRHRENIALFTDYNESNLFDKILLDKFIISKPQSISDIIGLTLEDINLLRSQIVKTIHSPKPIIEFKFRAREAFGYSTETIFKDFFIKEKNELIPYFDHDIGKLHLQMIYQILLFLRNLFNPQI